MLVIFMREDTLNMWYLSFEAEILPILMPRERRLGVETASDPRFAAKLIEKQLFCLQGSQNN